MKNLVITALLLSNLLLLPRLHADAAIVDTVNITTETALPTDEFQPHGYFTFRPDLRKCLSPLCGGVFVKAVNRALTRCADGSLQDECYVATVSNTAGIDIDTAALLQGVIRPKSYGEFGNLGVFKLNAAYRAATTTVGSELFVGLENNGIVCVTTPCFSFDQYVLNKHKIRAVSGVDLSQVGASQQDLDEATAIIGNGGVLPAAGVNRQTEELTGMGVTFIANQFYLPLE